MNDMELQADGFPVPNRAAWDQSRMSVQFENDSGKGTASANYHVRGLIRIARIEVGRHAFSIIRMKQNNKLTGWAGQQWRASLPMVGVLAHTGQRCLVIT